MALAERLAAIRPEPGDRLIAMQCEPEGRAAVSRAYYCAFHTAMSLIQEGCGVVLDKKVPEPHKKLAQCLENSADSKLAETGRNLNSLREERRRADYELAESKFATVKNVQSQISLAKQIVDDVKAAESRIAEFRASIRTYAKLIGLHLRSPSTR